MDANTSYLRQEQAREQAADQRQAKIDGLAADIYAEHLRGLGQRNLTGTSYQIEPGYNCWEALNDIRQESLHDVGVAISTGDELEVGRLIIAAVKQVLQKKADYSASDYFDNN